MTKVLVRAQISMRRYQSLQDCARREASRLKTAPAQANLGDEVLKTVGTGRGRSRVPLILVDDLDPLLRPSQVVGATGQVILPGGAGGVFAHLNHGGLADVDLGHTVEMIRPDLRDKRLRHHRENSGGLGLTLRSRDWTRVAPGTE